MGKYVALVGLLASGCSLYFDSNNNNGHTPTTPDAPGLPDSLPPPDGAVASLIGTDEPGVYQMAADGTYLYWVENGQFDHEANLRRMPLAGGAIETLYSQTERMYTLAVQDIYLVAAHTGTDYSGEVYKGLTSGGPMGTFATVFNPLYVTTTASWIYYSLGRSPDGALYRVSMNGGVAELLAGNVDAPQALAADGDTLFYAEMNKGRIMSVTPGNPPVELASGWVGTNSLAIDDTYVYFDACLSGDCGGAQLFRVARTGGTPELLAFGGPWSGFQLSLVGDDILWGSNVIPKTGGTPHQLAIDDALSVAAIATPDAYYWADFFTGNIYRALR